ncbi:MAG: primosomal protein N' [Nitrospirae bacterium]|nr:primosomal protein N' [Nitrospirota bacterium]
MLICDVVFPQKLSFLTYMVPEPLVPAVRAGQVVDAPIRGKVKRGIVLRVYNKDTVENSLKYIEGIAFAEPLYSEELLSLIEWTTRYYYSNHGTVLKSTPFKDFIKKTGKIKQRKPQPLKWHVSVPEEDRRLVKKVCNSRGYSTFLYKAADRFHELGFVSMLLENFPRGIVLVPEIRDAELVYSYLSSIFDERVCIYHSGLKRSERHDVLLGLYEGRYDYIIGTRSVVFAPFKRPSFVVVMREHNLSYKQEEAPRFHARDVAVMRGYLEKIPVVLTSVTPSSETYVNLYKKKYTLLSSSVRKINPEVFIIKQGRKKESIAKEIIRRIKALPGDESMLAIIHRQGYSLLICEECDTIVYCAECEKPLVIHKEGIEPFMQCHQCGEKRQVVSQCPRCGGYKLQYFGAGIERIEEELKSILGRKPVRVERLESVLSGEFSEKPVIVGTFNARRLSTIKDISIIVFLTPDVSLNRFEVKAVERFVQDVFYFRDFLKEKGKMLIQTSLGWHRAYKYIKNWDYDGFMIDELKRRRQHMLYPYMKTVSIRFSSNKGVAPEFVEKIVGSDTRKIICSGPLNLIYDAKGHLKEFQLIIRGKDSKRLRDMVVELMDFSRKNDLDIKIDVDPVFI